MIIFAVLSYSKLVQKNFGKFIASAKLSILPQTCPTLSLLTIIVCNNKENLQITQPPSHIARRATNNARRTSHVAHRTSRITHRMSNVAHRTYHLNYRNFHIKHNTSYVARRTLNNAFCISNITRSKMVFNGSDSLTRLWQRSVGQT